MILVHTHRINIYKHNQIAVYPETKHSHAHIHNAHQHRPKNPTRLHLTHTPTRCYASGTLIDDVTQRISIISICIESKSTTRTHTHTHTPVCLAYFDISPVRSANIHNPHSSINSIAFFYFKVSNVHGFLRSVSHLSSSIYLLIYCLADFHKKKVSFI